MKKAQGLSLNAIIVAILVLLVLVVLSLIFTGKLGNFRMASEDCSTINGQCVEDASFCSGATQKAVSTHSCPEEGPQVCCISV
jgi:hypothetical protein